MKILKESKMGVIVTTEYVLNASGGVSASILDGEMRLRFESVTGEIWHIRWDKAESSHLRAALITH